MGVAIGFLAACGTGDERSAALIQSVAATPPPDPLPLPPVVLAPHSGGIQLIAVTDAGDAALTVDDLDDAENVFQPVLNAAGTYGTFSINAAGNWSYTRTADLQSLAVGSSVTDSFTVTSFDGTGTEVVAITITGENDAPTITVGGPVNLITNGSFEAVAVGNVPGWVNGPGSMTGGSGTGN